MRIATWNTDNASPSSERGQRAGRWLAQLGADVICLTEAFADVLPAGGHTVAAAGDWGYPPRDERRRVLLWTRHAWTDPEVTGPDGMPPGRFVAATTQGVRFLGVCIPWRDARVRTGRRDRSPWGDHLSYLAALPAALPSTGPVVVLGDFNQRAPRTRQPVRVADALADALDGLRLLTAGRVAGLDEQLIDHVAISADLRAARLRGWRVSTDAGRWVSDHSGVTVDVEFATGTSTGVVTKP